MSAYSSATSTNRAPEENNIKSTQGSNKAEQKALNDQTSGEGPASLSSNSKRVPRNKPSVRPPLANLTMKKFLTNLLLLVLAISAFYIWRITVWASDAGGYWALITGKHVKHVVEKGVEGVASGVSKGISPTNIHPAHPAQPSTDPALTLQAQIYALASSLGVKPADLSAAIAPLTDPTAPNPFKVEREREVEELKAKVEEVKVEKEEKEPHLGLLGFVEEAFLD